MLALSHTCADPYYRTMKGFSVLVEKEWLSFGTLKSVGVLHAFVFPHAHRCAHLYIRTQVLAATHEEEGVGLPQCQAVVRDVPVVARRGVPTVGPPTAGFRTHPLPRVSTPLHSQQR